MDNPLQSSQSSTPTVLRFTTYNAILTVEQTDSSGIKQKINTVENKTINNKSLYRKFTLERLLNESTKWSHVLKISLRKIF